jgi:hypothetical protein
MAAPPADIYHLDLAPAITIDHGDNIAPPECAAIIPAVETMVLRSAGGEDEAAERFRLKSEHMAADSSQALL